VEVDAGRQRGFKKGVVLAHVLPFPPYSALLVHKGFKESCKMIADACAGTTGPASP
jgi:hypothetical protein